MRRYVIVGLLGLSLLFAALPFAGAAMFQRAESHSGGGDVNVTVVTEHQFARDEASAKNVNDDGGCPFASGQEATQF